MHVLGGGTFHTRDHPVLQTIRSFSKLVDDPFDECLRSTYQSVFSPSQRVVALTSVLIKHLVLHTGNGQSCKDFSHIFKPPTILQSMTLASYVRTVATCLRLVSKWPLSQPVHGFSLNILPSPPLWSSRSTAHTNCLANRLRLLLPRP